MRRKKLTRKGSRRLFKKTAMKTDKRNLVNVVRGGIRM